MIKMIRAAVASFVLLTCALMLPCSGVSADSENTTHTKAEVNTVNQVLRDITTLRVH